MLATTGTDHSIPPLSVSPKELQSQFDHSLFAIHFPSLHQVQKSGTKSIYPCLLVTETGSAANGDELRVEHGFSCCPTRLLISHGCLSTELTNSKSEGLRWCPPINIQTYWTHFGRTATLHPDINKCTPTISTT